MSDTKAAKNSQIKEAIRQELIQQGMPEELAGSAMDAWQALAEADGRLTEWRVNRERTKQNAQFYLASFHYFMQGFCAGRMSNGVNN